MEAIDFVVRDDTGALQRGVVQASEQTTVINAGSGQEISLNLRQVDMQGHARAGDALNIVLADGRVITIENYFNDAGPANRLFISADGYLNEVAFVETTDGSLYAQYGPTEQWGKWSPSDDLIYLGRTEIAGAAQEIADDEVSMLAPLALLGGGGLGAAGAAAAAAGVAAVGLGGGGSGGSGGGGGAGSTPAVPTVDDATSAQNVGGPGDDLQVMVSGTGEPGDTVDVTVGGQTATTTIADDGTWKVTLEDGTFPEDGVHTAAVVVTHPGGTTTDLSGPTFTIDTTAPEITISSGTGSTGEVFNSEELDGGATITGTGEAGASLRITSGTHTQTATVDGDGNWSVTWPAGTFAPGEYSSELTIVATDAFGNASTTTDTIVIDTVSEVSIATNTVAGDGTINGSEQAAGVTLTGSSQPGSTVNVTFGSTTLPAVVAANGGWSVDFPASAIPTGEYDATVTAVAKDTNGNSSTTTGTIQVDTLVNSFSYTSTSGGTDGVINATEAQSGLVVTGNVEPGSTVQVVLGRATQTATVAADGSWTATFDSGQLASGTYSTTMTATATDAAGNSSSIDQTVNVDTDAGVLTISSAPVEGDDIINNVEASDGVVLSGTADAGAIVQVTLGSVTHSVVANGNGVWQAAYSAAEIPAGTYTADIVATTTDTAGNTRRVTDSVQVDTRVDNLSVSANAVEGDNIINKVEQSDGVVLTGTTEPGSTVAVSLGSSTVQAVVDANGNWTASYSANQVPTGEFTTNVTVNATDAAGNTARVSDTVRVDTLVNTLNFSAGAVATDNIVNAAEARQGINLSGMVEPGSTVVVDFHGTTLTANVDAAGNWSIAIPASAIARGSYDASIAVMATDAAGNTETITDKLRIDTDAPDGPVIASFTRAGDGVRGISTELSSDDLTAAQVNADGSISDIAAVQSNNVAFNETDFRFASNVPDGSHLVVNSTDTAGNTSGTYVVFDDQSANSTVDLGNTALGNYQIESLDLRFAEEAQVSITEAQLVALSSDTDTLTIHGGADDKVNIAGATRTGTTQVDGQNYDVYSLGDGTVNIDDDITVNTVIG